MANESPCFEVIHRHLIFRCDGSQNHFWPRKSSYRGFLFKKIGPVMDKTLGQILVENRVISQAQLDLALRLQKQQKGKYLGQILIEMGYVSQGKINKFLDTYHKRKRIGEILLDLQIINSQQLNEALQKQKELLQKRIRRPLGMVVLELGYTGYDRYLQALSKHFNMPIISLEHFFPTPSLQKALGEKYAFKNRIVVLENTDTKIKLALAEPTPYTMEEIQRAFPCGKIVEFYLANPYEVDTCLRKKFDPFALTRYR